MGLLGGYYPAASIDGNQFVLAAQRNGLGTDNGTLNRIVGLVNNGMSVDSAAAKVAGKDGGKMPGLLGDSYDDPRTGMNFALAGGLLRGDFGGGLLGANDAYRQAKQDAMRQQYMGVQMQNLQSEIEARRVEAQQRQLALEKAQRLQAGIPGLFRAPGMTGGEAIPQTEAGIPMFSRPMQAAPMQATPGGFDVQGAVNLGMDPKMIQEYAALSNIGRQKVARTIKGIGPDGREYEYQVDEFGQRVGDGMPQYRAPISVNRGNSNDFLDPYTLQPRASLRTFQSPDSAASVAATLRGQNMVDARAREQIAQGKVPAGYRLSSDGRGLEYIPGGPADPNAAKRAAPTEFQGKAAMFGARAQEADRIITELEGKYSPAGINTKQALGRTPLVGGGLEAAANLSMSDASQRAEQAQRDFVNAVLRLESGAAIGKDEFENARRQYFPQPGDSQAVIAQKAANRKTAIQGLINNARPGAVEPINTGGATGSFAPTSPDIDSLLKKYGGK